MAQTEIQSWVNCRSSEVKKGERQGAAQLVASAQATLLLNISSPTTSWTSLLLHCWDLELVVVVVAVRERCDLDWDWEEPEEVRGS